MSIVSTSSELRNVTCPFCGIGCDDLTVATEGGRVTVRANGCRISVPAFERELSPKDTLPRVGGRPAALAQAAAEVARLLRGARQPLFGGLATDVAGARAIAGLAERCGGVLDHMSSAAALRNDRVLQDSGWITTTLTEVRNRADLLVVAGTDVVSRFPRFFERCIANRETLFTEDRRCEVIFLGRGLPDADTLPGPAPKVVPCELARLHEALGAVRALVRGRQLQAQDVAGVPMSVWRQLADRMRAATYGVIAWAAADLELPHAELVVEAICGLVSDLNREARFAGLPLGGSDGALTADSVHLWHTGFGMRTSYGRGYPEYDPHLFSAAHLLAGGEADVLVWVSSLDRERTPPAATIPTVVLGRAGMTCEREPAVFIPVGTPGLDHAGHVFRTDRVVALPLRQLRESTLPSVAEVAAAIDLALAVG